MQAGFRPLAALLITGLAFALLFHGSVRAQPKLARWGHWMHRPDLQPIQLPTQQLLQERQDERHVRLLLHRHAPDLTRAQRDRLALRIVQWSRDEGFTPLQTLALIQIESNFQPRAISAAGAAGILQLMPYVAQDVAYRMGYRWTVTTRDVGLTVPFEELPQDGEVSLLNPEVSLRLGLRYLAELRAAYPSEIYYYAAYNMGPSLLRTRLEANQAPHGIYYRKALTVRRQFESEWQAIIALESGWLRSRDQTSADLASVTRTDPAAAIISR